MSRVDELTQGTLKELVEEFTSQNRSLDELRREYVGVSMITLKAKLCGDGMARDIDFDLALKDLIDKKLVGTGPLAVIESPEISGVLIMPGLRSKNEYVYLKENGYRAAQKTLRTSPKQAVNHLHISGGTFHQSPIGMGEQITQSIRVSRTDAPVFLDLRKAVTANVIDSGDRDELLARIEAMEGARGSGGFMQRYQEFISCAANHMTVIGPFLPALTALLR